MPDEGPKFQASGREAERMLIAGMTRSGKTTKLREIVAFAHEGRAEIVYFDVKGLNDLGYPVVPLESVDTPDKLTAVLADDEIGGAITVQLQPYGATPEEQIETLARSAFVRGNLLFVLDDAMAIEGMRSPRSVNNIITQGAARGIGFIAVVQRVHWVPLVYVTEASHVIAFTLNGDEDRKRLSSFCHTDLERSGDLPKYHHLWYSLDDRRVVAYSPIALSAPSTT